MTAARPTLAILLCPALLLVACSSNGGGAEAKRQREELRAAGYKTWSARIDARDRAIAADKARAEAEQIGAQPAAAALRVPVDNWLKARCLPEPSLVSARPTPALAGFGGFKAFSWDLARGHEKVWVVDAVIEDTWYTFLVRGEELRGVIWEGIPAAARGKGVPAGKWTEDGPDVVASAELRPTGVEPQVKTLRELPY